MEIRRVRLNQGKTADNNLYFADNSGAADTGFVNASLYQIAFTSSWCCHKYRRMFYMPYFQDEWKVTPNLTLNLGLRCEYYGVAHEADNRTTVFDLNEFHGVCLGSGSTNGPFPTPINTPPCPRNPALYNPDYTNFDPRVSFAWAPSAFHGKTVIRAGYGIYHGAAQNDDLNAGLESDRFTAFVNLDPSSWEGHAPSAGLSAGNPKPQCIGKHCYNTYSNLAHCSAMVVATSMSKPGGLRLTANYRTIFWLRPSILDRMACDCFLAEESTSASRRRTVTEIARARWISTILAVIPTARWTTNPISAPAPTTRCFEFGAPVYQWSLFPDSLYLVSFHQ